MIDHIANPVVQQRAISIFYIQIMHQKISTVFTILALFAGNSQRIRHSSTCNVAITQESEVDHNHDKER